MEYARHKIDIKKPAFHQEAHQLELIEQVPESMEVGWWQSIDVQGLRRPEVTCEQPATHFARLRRVVAIPDIQKQGRVAA